jgi:hypothetical protein
LPKSTLPGLEIEGASGRRNRRRPQRDIGAAQIDRRGGTVVRGPGGRHETERPKPETWAWATPQLILEEFLVNCLEVEGLSDRHANVVAHHQSTQLSTVDEH